MAKLLALSTVLSACGAEGPSPGPEGGQGAESGSESSAGGAGTVSIEHCQDFPLNFTENTTIARGCYRVRATPSIGRGATLTLASGVRLVFGEQTKLIVRAEQSLIAEGLADDPVVFTAEEAVRGYWQGLVFDDPGTVNRLSHVIVEYAGGPAGGASKDFKPANVVSIVSSNLQLENSTLRESAGYGLSIPCDNTGGSLSRFTNNILTKNRLGPAIFSSSYAYMSSSQKSWSGNDVDRVTICSSRVNRLPRLGVPYYLPSGIIDGAILDAGTTLIFARGTALFANQGNPLLGVGTAEAPIILTAEEPIPGYWQGVVLGGPSWSPPQHDLQHVTVEYGGSQPLRANLTTESSAHVRVQGTTFQHSAGYGIRHQGTAYVNSDYKDANTFSDNALGDIGFEN